MPLSQTFAAGDPITSTWANAVGADVNYVYKRPWGYTNVKHETIPRQDMTTNLSILVSGRINYVGGIMLHAGVTYNGIGVVSGSTGATTPTNQWFALARISDSTFVRSTVNDTTTAWASASLKRLALSSSYTPSVDEAVYIAIMVAATTVPSLAGKGMFNGAVNAIAPLIAGSSETGQTTPQADGYVFTPPSGASSSIPFAYVD